MPCEMRVSLRKRLSVSGAKPRSLSLKTGAALVEEPQHHALAAAGRDRRDADVNLLVADFDPAAPVLRQALLGDVQVRHDLQPGDQRADVGLRRGETLAQHAVNAESHAHVALVRLDVDVARAAGDGLVEDRVDELDDRRAVGHVHQILGLRLAGRADEVLVLGERFEDRRGGIAVLIVATRQRILDRRRGAEDARAGTLDHVGHRVKRLDVQRIGERHDQAAVAPGERQDGVLLQEFEREAQDQLPVQQGRRDHLQHLQTPLAAERVEKFVRRNRAARDEDRSEADALRLALLELERFIQLRRRQAGVLQQDLSDQLAQRRTSFGCPQRFPAVRVAGAASLPAAPAATA